MQRMTKEDAIKILNREKVATVSERNEALDMAIEALEFIIKNKKLIDADKACERLLKAVKVFRENAAFDEANGIFYAYEIIRDEWDRLPQDNKNHTPVEKWECVEDDNYAGGGYWECPLCKYRFSFLGFNMLNDTSHCPECGGRVKTELEVEND
jgi:hypothetical protein